MHKNAVKVTRKELFDSYISGNRNFSEMDLSDLDIGFITLICSDFKGSLIWKRTKSY